MKVLPDHCVPRPLRDYFPDHEVRTAFERGWAALKNGALLSAASAEGFQVLVTTDQNLGYQQRLTGRRIAVLVLAARTNRLADLVPLVPAALVALTAIGPGELVSIGPPPG